MKIPKKKIEGLRFGQLIWNALAVLVGADKVSVSDKLFFIENDALQQTIENFVESIEGKFNE